MSHENDNDAGDPEMNDLSDFYQSTRNDEPGAALDAAILAQAEEAVAPKRKRPAWIAPLGLAATVLLGVNLAVNLKDYSSDPDVYMESSSPQSASRSESTPSVRSDDYTGDHRVSGQSATPLRPSPFEGKRESDGFEGADPSIPALAAEPQSGSMVSSNEDEEAGNSVPKVAADSPLVLSDLGRMEAFNTDNSTAEKAAEASRERLDRTSAMERSASRVEPESTGRNESEAAVAGSGKEIPDTTPKAGMPGVRPPSWVGSAASSPKTAESSIPSRDIPARPESQTDTAAGHTDVTGNGVSKRGIDSPLPSISRPSPEPGIANEERPASQDSEPQEIVVTGSRIDDVTQSPLRRLTAKDQVRRLSRQQSRSAMDAGSDEADSDQRTAASANPAAVAPVYACELNALGIGSDAMEKAKVEARTMEPPLTALTWPTYIRELAEEGDYVAACTHLAAYQQLFPDVVMIELLPVTIPASSQNMDRSNP